ncbi:MAG: hypothetical protein QF733_06260 [Phycisphaerales bacterium]|jgi:hypothetical protein|nr:hypothetical protein [Phycisphaerales bacterium]
MACRLICLMAIAISCTTAAFGSEPLTPSQQAAVLEQGRVAFEAGNALRDEQPDEAKAKFRRAAERWTLLVDQGVTNGPLLYDIGNAWVRSGDLGRGITAYLRAEQYIPGDARLQDNLAYARTLVSPQFASGDGTEAVLDRLTGWHESWTLRTRVIWFGLAWAGLWAVLMARRWGMSSAPRWLGGACGIAAGVLGLSVVASLLNAAGPVGVLIQDEVIVRKGNAETYQPRFDAPINGGVEFRVLEQQPVWLHVEFPSGEAGWVPRDAAEIVRSDTQAVTST